MIVRDKDDQLLTEEEGVNFPPGKDPDSVEAMRSTLSFLMAAPDDHELFRGPGISEWAESCSDELAMMQMEIEQDPGQGLY